METFGTKCEIESEDREVGHMYTHKYIKNTSAAFNVCPSPAA